MNRRVKMIPVFCVAPLMFLSMFLLTVIGSLTLFFDRLRLNADQMCQWIFNVSIVLFFFLRWIWYRLYTDYLASKKVRTFGIYSPDGLRSDDLRAVEYGIRSGTHDVRFIDLNYTPLCIPTSRSRDKIIDELRNITIQRVSELFGRNLLKIMGEVYWHEVLIVSCISYPDEAKMIKERDGVVIMIRGKNSDPKSESDLPVDHTIDIGPHLEFRTYSLIKKIMH